MKVDMEVDLVVVKVANMKVDKVADMKVDMVVDMGVDKVANMEVYLVVGKVFNRVAHMVADMDFSIIFMMFRIGTFMSRSGYRDLIWSTT